MSPKYCTFPDFYPTETKVLWSRKMKHRSSHVPKSWKKLRISRRLRGRSPWNQHLCFVSGGVREKVFRKSARNHLFSKNTFTRRDHETLEWCFWGFFQVNFAKMEHNGFGVSRGLRKKSAKSLQKAPSFEEQKLWKTPTFWSFWNFTERKNFVIFGWFSEISPGNFQHFSHFFYLKAQQLFSMVKFEFFLTLEAVVRAEKQNRKNGNCLIPRVGWRQMRGFHHFFNFFEKMGPKWSKFQKLL